MMDDVKLNVTAVDLPALIAPFVLLSIVNLVPCRVQKTVVGHDIPATSLGTSTLTCHTVVRVALPFFTDIAIE